ncbi:MAG: family 10 glycosylhydrolase [Acholeplasmataceae bacterium]|nr:family 10 glycosylhydrolase [Acholeplasmataceae bacterium]
MKKWKLTLKIFIILLTAFLIVGCDKKDQYETETILDQREFKAVWISSFINEVPYEDKEQFITYMEGVFEVLVYYGINALIFHVRTHNNAFYQSNINPLASWFSTVDFAEFDPLEWVIEESHKRGIEFHAWLNPYRVGEYYVGDYPSENPASNPNNIIDGKILNPALENVRQHLYNTIIELVDNYDVDAIHFDDYFYIQTDASPTSASARRENINILIEGIHNLLKEYNKNNNRYIQFGISPTGIYKNGNGIVNYDQDGKPLTTGSANTRGFEHYGNYLYADTVKWISEGWLDYLIPQVYWARDTKAAPFESVLSWWDKVVKHLDINLYSGIGVYMADENRDGWGSNTSELDEQFKIIENKLSNVKGYSIFSYKHLNNGYINSSLKSGYQIRKAYRDEMRRKIKVPPIISSMTPVILPEVKNLVLQDGFLKWDGVNGAKFYYIYAAEALTYSNSEIVAVVYSKEATVEFLIDSELANLEYGVRALSYTNHLSPISD